MGDGPDAEAADVTRDQLWEAIEYFLTEVVAVAEDIESLRADSPVFE